MNCPDHHYRAGGYCPYCKESIRSGSAPQTCKVNPELFWSKVRKTEDCWLWTGALDRDGYGKVGGQKTYRAHRIAFELQIGPIDSGMVVCHRCDTRLCVRPDHLFLGTQADNIRDCVNKQRQVLGERNGKRKLTVTQVVEIRNRRADGESLVHLANAFGVVHQTISKICTGSRWKHLSCDPGVTRAATDALESPARAVEGRRCFSEGA